MLNKKRFCPLITRIPFLIMIVLTLVFSSCSSQRDVDINIDHIILAINNLDSGVYQAKKLTGVDPIFGGIHPDSYTQNALISLGTGTYVEILAPRNDLDSVPDYFKQFDKLTPIGWAISSTKIESTRRTLENEGFKMGEIIPGSRVAANGKKLEWKTCVLLDSDDESAPFFISWNANTTHPSNSSTIGCRLE